MELLTGREDEPSSLVQEVNFLMSRDVDTQIDTRTDSRQTLNQPRPVAVADDLPADEEAEFRRVFDTYHHRVSGFFKRMGFDSEESRDLTQETFLRVYLNMDSWARAERPESWLFTIAANLYRNELRARQATKRAADEVPLEPHHVYQLPIGAVRDRPREDPLALVLHGERRRLLDRAVSELPLRMRRAVRLRIDHDLRYREIAGLMKTSVETVKAQLFQARRRLRKSLGSHFESASRDEAVRY